MLTLAHFILLKSRKHKPIPAARSCSVSKLQAAKGAHRLSRKPWEGIRTYYSEKRNLFQYLISTGEPALIAALQNGTMITFTLEENEKLKIKLEEYAQFENIFQNNVFSFHADILSLLVHL